MWHGFVLVESINLTPQQQSAALQALQSSGTSFSNYPQLATHYQLRPDGRAAIAESDWYEAKLMAREWDNIAAATFGIPKQAISRSTERTPYGNRFVSSISGVPMYAITPFWIDQFTDYETSRQIALNYLKDHIVDWTPPESIVG